MKGICLAFLLDYFGHKCVCEFFSLSTSEQEEVVVVVVGGGGLWVASLPYMRYKFRSLLPVSGLSQLVFVFFCLLVVVVVFFWGGGEGGCRGWWGERRQLNLPGVFTIRRRLHTSVNMRT